MLESDLAGYHQIALAQSRPHLLLGIGGFGSWVLIFLVASVVRAFPTEIFLSGVIVEIVAGIVFVLYGKTIPQLNSFHRRLDALRACLLANSLCEALDGDERQRLGLP
jgi:hypothetical protein